MLQEQVSIPSNPHKPAREEIQIEFGPVVFNTLGLAMKSAAFEMSFVKQRTRGPLTVVIFDMPKDKLASLVDHARIIRGNDKNLSKNARIAIRKFVQKYAA